MRFSLCVLLSISMFFTALQSMAYPLHIGHDRGVALLEKQPLRVVALNWTQAEMLLTLGITPVGLTSIKGYRQWQSNHPPLPDGVAELGHRGTPSLQAIAQLKPDLILGYSFRHAKLYQQLSAIAPTLIFDQYPTLSDSRNYFQRMQTIFMAVAQAVNKTAEAELALEVMHQRIAAAKQRIADAKREQETTLFGKFVGMGMGMRVYADQSLPGALINELGMTNGLEHGLPGRDFTHLQLAQLAQLQPTNLLYVGDLHKEGKKIISSPIWPLLTFVKQETLYSVPQLWSFGGPVAAQRMAEAFADALVNQ